MDHSVIVAGASGLIGQALLKELFCCNEITAVYALSRHPLENTHSKLIQVVNQQLTIPDNALKTKVVNVGVIALGTTLKKAGSKEKFREIDVELVVKTAREMQKIGVAHIIVVSCIGASISASSHYLRCKGEMEKLVEKIAFKQTTFLHPGPLAGERAEKRIDEKILHFLLKLSQPIMRGNLKNYLPIQASSVAQCVLRIIKEPIVAKVERLRPTDMINLIGR